MTQAHAHPQRALLAVLAAQLFTALADNALLLIAIALLEQRQAPAWATPALRIVFYAAYVLLAPLAGYLAERWRKGRLMLLVNLLKLLGATCLLAGAHPLLVFATIGLGAAAYAPARYGILPELSGNTGDSPMAGSPALLRANAWMEIVTIVAILGGVALGSALLAHTALARACAALALVYALAAACCLLVSGAPRRLPSAHAAGAVRGFADGARRLLGDPAARSAITLTSVFWAAAAVLQFLMIAWAREALGLNLAQAALLPAALAIGMVGGALLAGQRTASSRRATLGLAAALGTGIVLMPLARQVWLAASLLLVTGVLAGILLVPMNATLQTRGAALAGAGLSVAVQNFLENGLSLIFLACYGVALASGVSAGATLAGLGIAVLILVGSAARYATPAQAGTETPARESACRH